MGNVTSVPISLQRIHLNKTEKKLIFCLKLYETFFVNKCTITITIIINDKSFPENFFCEISIKSLGNKCTFSRKCCTPYIHIDALQS